MSIGETDTAGGGRSRWTAAARAYADELLDGAAAARAAAAGLDAAGRDGRVDDRDAVLDAVRIAVAQRVEAPVTAANRRGQPGRASATAVCPLVPRLLAARAAGRLSVADSGRLARHIESCADCAGLEQRVVSAERAFDAEAAEVERWAARPASPPPAENGLSPLAPSVDAEVRATDLRREAPKRAAPRTTPPAPPPSARPTAYETPAARPAARTAVAAAPPRWLRRPRSMSRVAAGASFFVLGVGVAAAAMGIVSLGSSGENGPARSKAPSASSRAPAQPRPPAALRPQAPGRPQTVAPRRPRSAARPAPAPRQAPATTPAPAPRAFAPITPSPPASVPTQAPKPAPAPRPSPPKATTPAPEGPKPSKPSSEPGRLPPS